MMLQMQFHETMQWDPLRLPISEVCIRQSNETCYQPLNPQGFASESIVLTIFVPPCPPILSRAVRPRALIGKKTCFHSKVGWKKCGITIGVHIMFVGSVENFMMLHFTYGCAFSMLWWQPIKINMKTYVHKLSWGSFYDVAFPGVLMAVTIYINKRLNQNLFRCVRMFNSKMWTD